MKGHINDADADVDASSAALARYSTTMRYSAILLGPEGAELAHLEARDVIVAPTGDFAGADGLHSIVSAMAHGAARVCNPAMSAVFDPILKETTCGGGCGNKTSSMCCNFAPTPALEQPQGGTPVFDLVHIMAGVCASAGSVCWDKASKIVITKLTVIRDATDREGLVAAEMHECFACKRATTDKSRLMRCSRCRKAFY
jgi:hypothetical protein